MLFLVTWVQYDLTDVTGWEVQYMPSTQEDWNQATVETFSLTSPWMGPCYRMFQEVSGTLPQKAKVRFRTIGPDYTWVEGRAMDCGQIIYFLPITPD